MASLPSCDVCKDWNAHHLKPLFNQPEAYTIVLDKLSASSKQCLTCKLMSRACRHCFPEVYGASAYFLVRLFVSNEAQNQLGRSILSLGISPHEFPETEEDPLAMVEGGWRKRVLHLHSISGAPCPWPLLDAAPLVSSDLNVLADQVVAWANDCEENHAQCNSNDDVLPKRVVQILSRSADGGYRTRLSESASPRRGKYVCLSHCWGQHQIITTQTASLKAHQTEIPWESLSQTFKDAIDITYRLGISAIWIDSLCIIQDSKLDWEEEAVKMAAYYANAHLTIAASAAADGTIGLLPRRPQRLDLQGTDARGRPYHLVARAAMDHPFDLDGEELHPFPLMTRGWVYQEHILSRRFVHFGPREVIWECHAATTCQCGIIPQHSNSFWTDNATNRSLSVSADVRSVQDRRRLWYENVESIMKLDFTFTRDRLPAAAGVASGLGRGYRGKYLAGLWEDCLVADLCWVIMESGRRPDELRAVPSWSWGSVEGGLATLWCQKDLSDTAARGARVVGIDCEPEQPSFIGLLTRGIITLQGRTTAAKVGHADSGTFTLAFPHANAQGISPRSWSFLPDSSRGATNMVHGSDACLLEMMAWDYSSEKRRSTVFLALQPVGGLYERIGLVTAHTGGRYIQAGALSFLEWFDGVSTSREIKVQ